MQVQRTIETILDLQTGSIIEADVMLTGGQEKEAEIFQLRTQIEKQIQSDTIRYVCVYCKKPVAVRGRNNYQKQSKTFYFTHPYKSPDCVIKTNHRLTEEEVRFIKYNGEKESILHDHLKNLLAHYLQLDDNVSGVVVEKNYKDISVSKEWRRPGVMAIFDHKKIAFELQLSTTFLSVIVSRTIFYQERNVFLLWIFPNFSLDSDIQKFTQKDVYYNNSFNVYVFDMEARERSEKAGRLIINCYYKKFYIDNEKVKDSWAQSYIDLSQLTYSDDSSTV